MSGENKEDSLFGEGGGGDARASDDDNMEYFDRCPAPMALANENDVAMSSTRAGVPSSHPTSVRRATTNEARGDPTANKTRKQHHINRIATSRNALARKRKRFACKT